MKRLVIAAILTATPLCLAAQLQSAARAPQNGLFTKGFRAEFLSGLDEVQDKITKLAAAVPAEKYSWRPARGVRSISEVYMHIAGGNYFLATFLGKEPPADIPKDLEQITDKQRILAELRKSIDFLRSVAMSDDVDLEKSVKMLGGTTTRRGVYVTMLNHLHEHLGQSIAYARMNGVIPPWSQ